MGPCFLHLPGRQTQEKNSFFGKRQARTRRRSFKKDPARDAPIAMSSTEADALRASRLHEAMEKLRELCNPPALNFVLIVQWLARRFVAATTQARLQVGTFRECLDFPRTNWNSEDSTAASLFSLKLGIVKQRMDTLGIEHRTFRMRNGYDTTTPSAGHLLY